MSTSEIAVAALDVAAIRDRAEAAIRALDPVASCPVMPGLTREQVIAERRRWYGKTEAAAAAVGICTTRVETEAAFIAAARTDIPALCAEVERLRAELAEVSDEAGHAALFCSVTEEEWKAATLPARVAQMAHDLALQHEFALEIREHLKRAGHEGIPFLDDAVGVVVTERDEARARVADLSEQLAPKTPKRSEQEKQWLRANRSGLYAALRIACKWVAYYPERNFPPLTPDTPPPPATPIDRWSADMARTVAKGIAEDVRRAIREGCPVSRARTCPRRE